MGDSLLTESVVAGPAATSPESRSDVLATIAAVAVAATVAALAWLVLLWRSPPTLTAPMVGITVVLSASIFYLQTRTLVLPWRNHGVAMHLDEIAIFLALMLLPAYVLPLMLLPATVLTQVIRRRSAVKVTFNTASEALSVCVAAMLFVGLSQLVHPAVAALVATAWHTVCTNTMVAIILSRIERAPLATAFRERFSVEVAFQAALGCSVGLVLFALLALHPLALLAAIPFLMLARQFAEYRLRSERVLHVHDRMTRLTQALSRAKRREDLAEEILAAVGDLFRASSATLTLVGRHGQSHATWTRRFPYEPREWGKLDVMLPGSDGLPLGIISVDIDNASTDASAAAAPMVLRLLAQQAGAALEQFEQAHAPPARRA